MMAYLQSWKNAYQLEIILSCILIIMISVVILKKRLTSKQFKVYVIIVLSLYVLCVFYATVLSRESGGELKYNYELFWSYKLVLSQKGYLSEIGLNILLFVPIGIVGASVMRKRDNYWVLLVFGMIFSGSIEILQYLLKCGFSEVDDVISNSLGILMGIIVWECVQFKLWKS